MQLTLGNRPVLEHRGNLPVLAWPALARLGADVVMTTREGGVSQGRYASLNLATHVGDDPAAVAENRRRLAAALEVSSEELVFVTQVHGRAVHRADGPRRSESAPAPPPEADVLVCSSVGPVLAILVADCMPIALFDPLAKVLACAHGGWRGTLDRVGAAAVQAMVALGAHPADMVALMGPAVDARTYQVGNEVAAAARACFPTPAPPGWPPVLRPDGTGRWLLDLAAANRRVLVEAGVPDSQISAARLPTGPPGPFFSHRAEGPCGRMAMVARILSTSPSTPGNGLLGGGPVGGGPVGGP